MPQRRQVLDDIAWPTKAEPGIEPRRPRSSTASATCGERVLDHQDGIQDLQYQGNTLVADWEGLPGRRAKKLGVRYES